jgi:dTDP-4-dehydrorhamnose reductase
VEKKAIVESVEMMRVLIFGKDGQVGRELMRLAPRYKLEIIGYNRAQLDVTDFKKLKKTVLRVKPDIIINTASYHVVADCEENLEEAFNINVFSAKRLAVLCRDQKIRLVTFSTDKVFDGTKKTPYRENDTAHPLQMYGLTKHAREIASLLYNPDTLVIRTCGIFGGKTGSRSKKGNFVLYILEQAKVKHILEISSEQTATFANAEDLASAVLRLAKKKGARGIFHLVNEGSATWAKFAQEIVKLSKSQLTIVPVNRKGTYLGMSIPRNAVLKNIRAKKMGVVLPHWKDGLKRYINFLQTS